MADDEDICQILGLNLMPPKKTFQPTTLLSIFSTLPCQETASHPEHAGFETVARDGPGERGCDSHCQTMETVVT